MAAAAAALLFTLLSINQPQAGARPQTWLNKDKDSSSLQAQKYFKQKNKYSVSFELFITYVEQLSFYKGYIVDNLIIVELWNFPSSN